jgi:hypothetical protein
VQAATDEMTVQSFVYPHSKSVSSHTVGIRSETGSNKAPQDVSQHGAHRALSYLEERHFEVLLALGEARTHLIHSTKGTAPVKRV